MNDNKCHICGKEKLTKNEIGLNKKLINKNIKKFQCIECLSNYINVTIEELSDYIEEFKAEGCNLF